MLNNQLRIISYLVIFYMLLAFSWWTVLLHTKNRDAFLAKNELLKLSLIAKNEIKNEEEFLKNSFHIELRDAYKRQEWMILGEASVFVLSLLIGIVFINRGYHKEILAAKQSSNFLLSITHELKSPIASIRLGFETLQRKKLSEEQAHVLLKNGINDTDRLNNLVSDLLLSARLESTYQLNTELFSLEILIEECVQLLKQKFPSAILKVNLIQEMPEILADYSAIRSVIINLLENAVKYSDSVPEINIGLTSNNERCVIEISDKGIGIDQNERKKIFEKFYRIGNEDQRKTKGTGLGLYIVDQIVRAHNGSITVSSNQPKGTIFNVFLPFN
ncbi:MAG: sensor histidine kinase [Saprospiraceae bacterium]|jgi:two-component system phosphate regulon sensor histidine kinase PhoR